MPFQSIWRTAIDGQTADGTRIPPLRRGLQLSTFALLGIFLPAALAISYGVYRTHGTLVLSGLVWVTAGAMVALPGICFAYAHLAYRKGEPFARTWLVAPLILVVLASIAGFFYHRIYVVGFD